MAGRLRPCMIMRHLPPRFCSLQNNVLPVIFLRRRFVTMELDKLLYLFLVRAKNTPIDIRYIIFICIAMAEIPGAPKNIFWCLSYPARWPGTTLSTYFRHCYAFSACRRLVRTFHVLALSRRHGTQLDGKTSIDCYCEQIPQIRT